MKNFVKNIESKLIVKKIEKKKFNHKTLTLFFTTSDTFFFFPSQIRLNNCFGIVLKIVDVV